MATDPLAHSKSQPEQIKKLVLRKSGAGDEIRTRDPQLGRLMLYQLSYTRSKLRMKEKSATRRQGDGAKRGSLGVSRSFSPSPPPRVLSLILHPCSPWCRGQDSNLRRALARRVYSPVPLTARPPLHASAACWSRRRDLNPRPSDYKSDALPTELRRPATEHGSAFRQNSDTNNRLRKTQVAE